MKSLICFEDKRRGNEKKGEGQGKSGKRCRKLRLLIIISEYITTLQM